MNRDLFVIENLKKGDKASFESIYNKYSEDVYYVALGYLKNKEESEDMTQKIFTKLWENKSKLSVDTSLKYYLHKATINNCLNYLRHEKVKRQFEDALAYENSIETPSSDEISALIDEVNIAIDKLPEQCRKIFVLSCVVGMKQHEIAEELDISINTVKMHKKIAYKRIRGSVSPDNILLYVVISQLLDNF